MLWNSYAFSPSERGKCRLDYVKAIMRKLRNNRVRAQRDLGADLISGKIANAERGKIHTILVIGARDMEFDSFSRA